MNRMSILKATTLSVAMLGLVSMTQIAESEEGTAFCSCSEQLVFDHSLPMSHPINRCAAQQETGVSWLSWFAGRSSSYQFHYLDLLELLSRDTPPATGSTSKPGTDANR